MRTHNRLLGAVPGCDGLKTGYFTDAGYSIAATAQRDGARVIAVVMGSVDRKVRDAKATELLARGLLDASRAPVPRAGGATGLRTASASPVAVADDGAQGEELPDVRCGRAARKRRRLAEEPRLGPAGRVHRRSRGHGDPAPPAAESMKASDFDYDLPPELIAQEPAERRDAARMMVLDRAARTIEHRRFADLPAYLRPTDLLVVNDTRVIPARVFGRKAKAGTGGKVEFLLLEETEPGIWDALMRSRRRPRVGEQVILDDDLAIATVLEDGELGRVKIRMESLLPWLEVLDRIGQTPLPPYIQRKEASSGRTRRRQGPLPDRVCTRARRRRRADGRIALHAGGARTARLAGRRPGHGHAPRRHRHLPARDRGERRRSPDG